MSHTSVVAFDIIPAMMSFGVNWLPVGLQAHTVFGGFMFTATLVKPVGVGVQIQDSESGQLEKCFNYQPCLYVQSKKDPHLHV